MKKLCFQKRVVSPKLNKCKNLFPCLFSVHNTVSLSCHEQVCLIRLHFEKYYFHHRVYDRKKSLEM